MGFDFGNSVDEVLTVSTVETMVFRLLTQHHLHLSHLEVVVVVVVVEVFLIKVENDPDVGSTVDVFKLVAGEFGNNERQLVELVENVKQGNSHVAS